MVFPGSFPKGRCNRRYIGHSLHNPQRKGANELHALGRHLVLELNGCNPKLLNDVKRVEEILVAAAKIAKATIVGTHFHQFSPFGISGIVVIAESHVSVHTWPEHGYAAVDIFTCNMEADLDAGIEAMKKHFLPGRTQVMEVRRGLQG